MKTYYAVMAAMPFTLEPVGYAGVTIKPAEGQPEFFMPVFMSEEAARAWLRATYDDEHRFEVIELAPGAKA